MSNGLKIDVFMHSWPDCAMLNSEVRRMKRICVRAQGCQSFHAVQHLKINIALYKQFMFCLLGLNGISSELCVLVKLHVLALFYLCLESSVYSSAMHEMNMLF